MRILAIIPARSGSKGVPGKNIKLLGGKPLIWYTANSAKEAKLITDIIISTDSEEIADLVSKFGVEVPFIRPAELATDTASSVDVVIHAVKELSGRGKTYDAVCLLQPTNPFRQNGFIDKAIQKFIDAGTDSLVSVLPVPDEFNPHWIFEANENDTLSIATGEKEIIRRRQDLPRAFYRDGSVYLTRTSTVLKDHSLYGNSIGYIINNPDFHVNIDTEEDWKAATELQIKISE
jgi:N-acylneuraminate cytidylyltransferase